MRIVDTKLADLLNNNLFEQGNESGYQQEFGSLDHIPELKMVKIHYDLFLNDSLFVCNPDGNEVVELTYHGLGQLGNDKLQPASYLVSTGDYSYRHFHFIDIQLLLKTYKCYTYKSENM